MGKLCRRKRPALFDHVRSLVAKRDTPSNSGGPTGKPVARLNQTQAAPRPTNAAPAAHSSQRAAPAQPQTQPSFDPTNAMWPMQQGGQLTDEQTRLLVMQMQMFNNM